jgi:hypothetical protein
VIVKELVVAEKIFALGSPEKEKAPEVIRRLGVFV